MAYYASACIFTLNWGTMKYFGLFLYFQCQYTVIGIMQPTPKEGALSVLVSNLYNSKSGFDNYAQRRVS